MFERIGKYFEKIGKYFEKIGKYFEKIGKWFQKGLMIRPYGALDEALGVLKKSDHKHAKAKIINPSQKPPA